MTHQERLELLAVARAGHCALQLAAECGEADAVAVLRGAIKSFVSALVSLDRNSAHGLLRELGTEHFAPDKSTKIYLAVSNTAEVVRHV